MSGKSMHSLICQLREAGVHFAAGLTEAELDKIEEIYDIRFPESLRMLYACGLPVSETEHGFPVWNDFSPENTEKIRERITAPVRWLFRDITENGCWRTVWGERPVSREALVLRAGELCRLSPKLIPVYSHRYLPDLPGIPDPPVFSTVGQDTVWYGADLEEYLQNEFLRECSVSEITAEVPLWSDVIRGVSMYEKTDALREKIIDLCMEIGRYTGFHNVKKYNSLMDIYHRMEDEIGRDAVLFREVFLPLLEHENEHVRAKAAANCLLREIEPERCIAVLEEIADSTRNTMLRADSGMLLWLWSEHPEQVRKPMDPQKE